MTFEEINVDSINKLMDIFYAKVRADKSGLGDIFNTKIGTSDEVWEVHKAKIANFWQGMLLNSGDYNGQPLKAHLDLPPFPRELFNVWLNLFEESLRAVYAKEEHISLILQRAQMIAQRFQYIIYESGLHH
ncbi:group III truncated hemoglobin [Helicobacter sp. MIT 03-1614]|uniref:group III truncated hemoglobin n=1 Tax=Helicobacter sp. MIT 03-1614 TaxID=1548147 RepID=UPI0005138D3E|nr:group III truncated hemoglobin [Helicobacter sp. MIT 03-1614]TLD87717.1 group III truncated hemoglobin [Helicobacter sp. MIT 03-1614]